MTISEGDRLPEATLARMGDNGPEQVQMSDLVAGKKVVIFGLPGAYTGTCSTAHVPSFMRTMDGLGAKGIEAVYCVSVNDPFVMDAWGKDTGATTAGIGMLGDPAAEFTKAIGMNFTAPPVGFFDRSRRFAMMVEDGTVKVLHLEENPGVCETSSGEAMLDAI
ncbi:peroxiredoxin [Mameliella alba]|nr:peroxiredoxin [Mameliella alba]MBY6171951.1 peroxiredoxin [Mameliella alba]MBY6176079.1 peroxiredoxin [Mameliella alba]